MSEDNDRFEMPEITSPPWQTGTRLMAGLFMIVLMAAVVLGLRQLIGPLMLAGLLSYLLFPIVERLQRWTRMSRNLAVVLVFLLLLLILAGATTGAGFAISQQISGLVTDLTELSRELPDRLRELSELSIDVGPWMLDLSEANLDPVINSLVSTVQPFLSRTGTILASALSATATTIGLLLLVLVMSYYLLRDFGRIDDALLGIVPDVYQEDFQRLLNETGTVWQSFLRGQLILAVVMGVSTWLIYTFVGLPFALGLGLIAGLMEFVPIFGPIVAGALAVLVAIFQPSNWFGLSPFAYSMVILVIAILIQQVENNFLVPRIIGHSLNLHPLIVLIAALAGGIFAGVLGILLAAPTVATLRIWLGYVYRKTVRLGSWPSPILAEAESPSQPGIPARAASWIGGVVGRFQARLSEGRSQPPPGSSDQPEGDQC